MPATGTSAAFARTRGIRLVGLLLTLLFIGSVGTAWAQPVDATDLMSRVQTTRRAQAYWETVMRSADAELRRLTQRKRQTQKRLKAVKTHQQRAVHKRVAARKRLKQARADLAAGRVLLKAGMGYASPLPEAARALQTLVEPTDPPVRPLLPASVAGDDEEPVSDATMSAVTTPVAAEVSPKEPNIRKLERKVKRAVRALKQAKRQTRRSVYAVRSVKRRLISIRAATRGATARRESAERNLGAWILTMTKYGRMRAAKKSRVRPGVNSSFAWPARGRISQRYHAGHDGLDIVSYSGAPVRSMAFGVVTYVGWNPWDQHRRAFMVVVTHAGGYETLYGHLRPNRIVRVGQEVRKGQLIGYMGNTGNSTGTHLHLELRRGRTTLDPLGVL